MSADTSHNDWTASFELLSAASRHGLSFVVFVCRADRGTDGRHGFRFTITLVARESLPLVIPVITAYDYRSSLALACGHSRDDASDVDCCG